MNRSDQYIDRVKQLPPTPTVATQLLGLFGNPDRDIDQVIELISLDPALTAEVLKRSNSAVFGGTEPFRDIFEAVSRVGFYEVYCIVAGQVGSRTMTLLQDRSGIDPTLLWRHSVTTAVAAATLAGRSAEANTPPAFTAGLLHDIGKLIFASSEPQAYPDLVRRVGGFGPDLVQAEEELFGVTHAAVGGRLLSRWSFPPDLVAAVGLHHGQRGPAEELNPLAATVYVANHLAHHLVDTTPLAAETTPGMPEAMTLLGLENADLDGARTQVQADLERVQGMLQGVG